MMNFVLIKYICALPPPRARRKHEPACDVKLQAKRVKPGVPKGGVFPASDAVISSTGSFSRAFGDTVFTPLNRGNLSE
jgi:hypothetical protein